MMERKERLKKYFEFAKSLEDTIKFVYQTDEKNIWRFSGYFTYMQKYNQLVQLVANEIEDVEFLSVYDLDKVGSPYDTIAITQKNYFDGLLAQVSILRSLLENKLDLKNNQIDNLKNFFQINIRKAIFDKPEKEREVQNVIEQLLIGKGLTKGIDYDREIGRVKVSVKEVIPDFIFHKLDLALEVKLCRDYQKSKRIVDEINADIRSYSKHFGNILFIVYDIGGIRDEEEFKNDLDNKRNISLIIIKH